jgi:ribonuclease VapC
VIVVDASALIAVLRNEADGSRFEAVLVEADICLVSSVSLLEDSMVLAGRYGDATAWLTLDDFIARVGITVHPHDAALTDIARLAFLRFGKGRHPAQLNFGDCASYALAKQVGCALLFKGEDFSRTDIPAAV